MKKSHFRALLIRLLFFGTIGGIIILRGETDAARYNYDNTVVSKEAIPKLDRQTYIFLNEYGKNLKNFSQSYRIDWRLALAVLRAESGFDPQATSDKGAAGFMQLMPGTGLYLASLYDVNVDDLSDPLENMKLGVIHLRDMLRLYSDCDGTDRLEMAVAAYNCGPGRIQDAQTVAEYLGDKPALWTSVRSALPLLSARYSPLHEHIWQGGRPVYGTFEGYQQTLTYVENVMQYYNIYRTILQE
jgi:membrane-bound lytic murein transglycosylase MltF